MGVEEVNSEVRPENENETSLKGTIFSVSVVGAVILIFWVGLFALYMMRV